MVLIIWSAGPDLPLIAEQADVIIGVEAGVSTLTSIENCGGAGALEQTHDEYLLINALAVYEAVNVTDLSLT